jgi:guanylate kinase
VRKVWPDAAERSSSCTEDLSFTLIVSTREALLSDIAKGRFLEHATVHGNLYGTSFDAIRNVTKSGRICILDVDIQVMPDGRSTLDRRVV